MDKKDVISKEDCPVDIFQQIMTDKLFDPFGTFYTLGRHFNPITQEQLEHTYIEDVSKELTLAYEEYYQNITSKTKDDDVIFDPQLNFMPILEDTIFSSENIVEFDQNFLYKKLKLQNSQDITFKVEHTIIIELQKKKTLRKGSIFIYSKSDVYSISQLIYSNASKNIVSYFLPSLQQLLMHSKTVQNIQIEFKMYEYASFDLFRMKDTKKLDEINLTLDFVTMTAQMTKEGQNIDPKFNFKEIEGANSGYVSDEVYLTLRQRESTPTILKFKVKYCFQRDFAVEVFNLVNHFCRKYPKKAQTTYTNDDANLHKQEYYNKLEILKIRRTKLSIIKSDNIIPPKSLLSYRASFKYKDKKCEANFTVGINNIVVHSAQYMEDKLQPEPKAKSREKKLYDFIYHVIPFNHSYFYCDQGSTPFNKQLKIKLNSQELQFEFETAIAVSNVITAIKGVQSGDIMSDQVYIHIQTKQNEKQNSIKEHFFRAKSKEISKLIAYHKEIVNQLQSAKTVLDFEYYKDFEVYNSDEEKQEKGKIKNQGINQFNQQQEYGENIDEDDYE